MSVPEPLIAGEIKCLLRGAGAFDWHGRLREERASAAELLHKLPSVGRKVKAIVGCDAVLAQRLGKAFDGAPIELDAGRRDEHAISNSLAIVEDDLIDLGRERRDRALEPAGTARYEAFFVPFGAGRPENTSPDERQAGLVIVFRLRLDDQNIEVRPPLEQAPRRGEAGGPPSDPPALMKVDVHPRP